MNMGGFPVLLGTLSTQQLLLIFLPVWGFSLARGRLVAVADLLQCQWKLPVPRVHSCNNSSNAQTQLYQPCP
jgi:hypothetical protein